MRHDRKPDFDWTFLILLLVLQVLLIVYSIVTFIAVFNKPMLFR